MYIMRLTVERVLDSLRKKINEWEVPGIGRITKGLLLPLFERVDMVDANSSFL